MRLIRENDKVLITNEEGKNLLEMGFLSDEFVMIFYTSEPLLVPKEIDEDFYNNISSILDNDYTFNDRFSSKKENELGWLSDATLSMTSEKERDDVNRLIISKDEEGLYFETFNPYFEERGLIKEFNLIAFSPAGNGRFAKNNKTNSTLQNDMINAYFDILNKSKTRTR